MGISPTKTGKRGEDLAVEYLIQNGYTVLERNYRFKRFEIDIIASKGGILIFIEVKFRGSNTFGYPESFVDQKKADNIMEAADEYIYEVNWQNSIRFDIVSIESEKDKVLTHFKDAFY